MTLDDGILKIYSVENAAEPGEKPAYGLKLKSEHYFAFETVGIQRHYAAMQANSKITELVRIWEDRGISGKDICILEDQKQYKCSFVQHMKDEEGLRITKITLERLENEYAVPKAIQAP